MSCAYFTPKQVAERWNLPLPRVNKILHSGVVPAFRIGRTLRVRAATCPDRAPELPPRARKQRIRKAPVVPASGVYLLYLAGALIYIGRSTELPRRITNHRRAGRVFDEVRAIPCEYGIATWLEAELIRTLGPPENIKRFERRTRRVDAGLEAISL